MTESLMFLKDNLAKKEFVLLRKDCLSKVANKSDSVTPVLSRGMEQMHWKGRFNF